MLLFFYVLRETLYEIRPMEERAALFPMFLGVPCLALALLAFGQELFKVLRRATGAANSGELHLPSNLPVHGAAPSLSVSWI